MENQNENFDERYRGSLDEPTVLNEPATIGSTSGSGFGHRRLTPFSFNKLAFAVTTVAVLAIVGISGLAYFLMNSSSKKPNSDTPKADKYSVSSVSTSGVQGGAQLQVGTVDHLAVNGKLQVSKTLVITPTAAPSAPTKGQIYFDKTTNTPYYYDGTEFVSFKPQTTSIQGVTGSVNVGGGISLVNSTLVNSGVISIQGQTGAVNFAGGSGIAINGSTITNTGVLGLAGNPNQLAITSGADGNVQLQIIGIQDGGVLIGTTGSGIDTVMPTAGGQCLISDPSTQKPVFGSCSGAPAVTGITVGSTTLTNTVVLQGAGGIAVTQSGQTVTIDGSSIAPGGDVSFGATHTAGHITMLDTNGDLVNSDISQLSGGLQVQQSNYFVDLANSGTSTLTVKNSSGSNVANLTVTGVVQANGGIKDSNGNLYSFATTPSGSSRTLCYVDNLNASNCPTGGNVSRSGAATNNRLTKFDNSGNIQNSALTETGSSLQVLASAYSIDLQNSGSNSTLSILNSDGTRVANLSVEGSISTSTGFLQGADLYTLPTNSGNGGVLCYVYGGISNCPTGGNVSYGTASNGYVTYRDSSGTLSTTDLAFTPGKLQATAASYTLDFVNNSGASTLSVTNSGSGGVANLLVSGSVTATNGLIAHTLTDNTANGAGNDLRITSSNNNIVFSINGGSDTFIFPTGGGTGQTICTSGISCASGGGQAVILEPGTGSGTAQISSANRPSIWINRTGGTGNIIQLQAGGSDAFVIDSSGAATIPMASGLTLGTASATTGKIAFKASGNSNTVNLTVSNSTSGYTLTLPSAAGSSGQCLSTTGGGVLTFTNCLTGGGGNGVTAITDGSNSASGTVQFTSSDNSVQFVVGSNSVDFKVPAGATGVTTIGAIDSQTKSANGAVISGSTLYLQTADASNVGLVSTGSQSFAGNKTFAGNVSVQGGSLTVGNGATQGSLVLVSASSGSNITIKSNNQVAARNLIIPTIGADDEICLKTAGNCASTGSNFIVNGTSQQTSANFNIQSTAGAVAAKIQGASGQDIVDFYGSASSSTPVAKIDGSGNLTAVGGSFTGNLSAVAATFTGALSGTTGSFSGSLSSVGVNSGSGLIQGTGGLTVGGAITLSSLGAGVLHSSAGGVISSSAVQLGTDTSGNYVANLGTLTGLTTTGNSGAGSTPTLSVNYGSLSNTAVQGNTTVVCAGGTGNLTGGGTTITLGSGGTCGSLNLVSSPTITGNMVVQGGSLSLGVNGTATGQLKLGNATASSQFVTLQADSRSVAATITIPTGSQTSDEVCLKTLANCTGNGSGGSNFIINGTSQQTGANFNIQSASGQVAAKIQGASGQDIIDFYGSASASTPVAKIDGSGNLTAVAGTFSGNIGAVNGSFSGTLGVTSTSTFTGTLTANGGISVANNSNFGQTGSGTFSTGTGAVTLNGSTTVNNGNLTLGNGASQGVLTLVSASSGSNILFKSANQTANRNLTVPTLAADDTLCLVTLGNCTGANSGSGNTNYIFNQTTPQASANFNIDGNGTIGTNLTVNGTSTLNGATTVKVGSTSALQVQNASGNSILNVNTSNGKVSLGDSSASGVTGQLVFNTANNANSVTLQSGATSTGYTLTLPTAIGSANQCLTAGGVGSEGQLQFQSCSGASFINGGNSFGAAASLGTNDNNSLSFRTNNANRITLDTSGNLQFLQASTLNVASATTGTQLTIKGGDATSGTNTGGNLLLQGGAGASTGASGSVIVKSNTNNSTTAFQVQNAAGTALLNADTTNLRVSVGSKGTASGQLYVAGNTPTGALSASTNSVAGAYGLAIQGRYAYVTPTNATGLIVYDISNPAASPLPVMSSTATTSSANKKVKVIGKYAYVAGGGTLQIFDISNPKSPSSVGSASYTSGTNIPSIYVQGRYAYVGDSGTPTLYVFDISNPTAPVLASSVAVATTSNGPAEIYAQGRYAYIVNGGTNRFQIVDVSNPLSPSLSSTITSTNITSVPTAVAIQGRYAYLGTSVGAVYVIDVSDPSTPTVTTSVSLSGGSTHSLAVQGRYLYAGDATNGLIRTIDISTPASASLISGTTTASAPLALVADGRYVYAANNTTGVILQSFDFGGAYTQQLEAGGIETDSLNVRGNTNFASDVAIQGSLGVGTGLQVAGNSGFNGAVGIQTNSANALQVKNSSGSTVVNVDASNSTFAVNGTTYSGGTISQTGNLVSGTGTAFSQAMVGGTIFYNDGTSGTVLAVSNYQSLTSSVSKTVASGSSYSIYYGGLRTSSTGATQIQTTTNSTAGFQVQNAFGSNLLTVDTTSNSLIYNGTFDSTVSGWSASSGFGSVTWSTTGVSGGGALMVFSNGTNGDFINTTLSSATTVGQSYTLSFYAKKNSAGTDTLTAFFGGGSVSCGSISNTSSFVQFTCSRTATSASTSFSLSGGTTTNGEFMDNITLLPTGASLSVGNIIAGTTITGVSATTTNTAGSALTLAGGSGVGNGAGGDINLQIAKPGSSGSLVNLQSTVVNISGSTGAATFKNAADSTAAFQVQNSNSNVLFNVDTQNNGLYVGNAGLAGTIQIGNTTGAVAQTINIGNNNTNSSSTTINIGSTKGTSPTTIQGGSSGITLNSAGGVNVNSGNLYTQNGFGVWGTRNSSSVQYRMLGFDLGTDVLGMSLGSSTTTFEAFYIENAAHSHILSLSGYGGATIQTEAPQSAALTILDQGSANAALTVSTQNINASGIASANTILKVAKDNVTGRSIGANGTINASGADYAEWIPWTGVKPVPGSIVVYTGSNFVVSSIETAGFIGNDNDGNPDMLLVTFAGQVPVRVTGAVSEGDILIDNGDGTARAVHQSNATVGELLAKIAIAQEASNDDGVKIVKASVGTTASSVASALQNQTNNFSDIAVSGSANLANLNVSGASTLSQLIVTGSAAIQGTLTVTSINVGDISVNGHIITAGDQLASQIQAAAGTGASISVDGNDITGTITVTTGTAPQAGDLAKILFSRNYDKAPHIVISPSNNESAGLRYYKGAANASDFMLRAKDIPTANTTYVFDYFIAQ